MKHVYVILKHNSGCSDYVFAICSTLKQAKATFKALKTDKHYEYYPIEIWKVPVDSILVKQILYQDKTIPSFSFGTQIIIK